MDHRSSHGLKSVGTLTKNLMSISEIAVKRPLLVTTVFIVLILFGALSYQQLSYNLLPKFEANVISVATTYRGASADEVETNVTKRIEDALSSLEGLDRMTSTSQEGASIVVVQLKNGVSTTPRSTLIQVSPT